MSILVSSLLVLTGAFAFLTNRDMFSPGKFYLISFAMFYAGALLSPDDYELWLLMLLVLVIGVATVCLEAGAARRIPRAAQRRDCSVSTERNVALWIWFASLPAIAAQVYIVHFFNGLEGYINMIGNRVIETRGLGWAKTLTATILILNLMYFGIGLTRRRSTFWWALWGLHLLVVLVMGALSGSRGSILTVFPLQLFLYHYLRRPVKIVYALPIGLVLVGAAIVIGFIRQGLQLEDGAVSTGLDTQDHELSLSIFNYGVLPLKILLHAADLQLANGSTLISVLTNAIPRNFWPDKPDTGGVFFTKVYTGDAWEGASNLTPTFLGEGVINFGWLGGLVFFVTVSLVLMWWVVRYYKRIQSRVARGIDAGVAIDVVLYGLVMWAAVALMVGEVTNTVQILVMTQVLPALVMKAVLVKKRAGRPASA
jgi:oligosaccharide repeat unit polymerase